MSDRWVISLSGVKGQGPWVTSLDPTTILGVAHAFKIKNAAVLRCSALSASYPSAKVFRLVRKGTAKPTRRALRDAVVEAACELIESNAAVVGGSGALASLVAKVRALRAHERGE